MGYRRNSNSGGSSRGGSRGRGGRFEQKDMTGTLWGNQYREEDKHPVLQGEMKVDGVMYKISGFFNVSYDNKEDRRSLQDAGKDGDDINNILLDAFKAYGGKFSLVIQDKEEWERDREDNGGSRGSSRGRGRDDRDERDDRRSRGRDRDRDREDDRDEDRDDDREERGSRRGRSRDREEEKVPFNERERDEPEGDDGEPEGEPEARPRARRNTAGKSSEKTAAAAKPKTTRRSTKK